MLLVLSPSKSLDFETPAPKLAHTQPEFLKESQTLIKILRDYSPAKLSSLMDISDKLAALNVGRFQQFKTPFTEKNAKQALLAFTGDVYSGIETDIYKKHEFDFAQNHVRILSGLYGLLRPLDLMQPYRLEMGTSLKNPRGKDLYAFWGDRITQAINQELADHKSKILINLASEEYFSAVRPKKLESRLINIVFKENHKGKLKIIALFAKKARGMMANYIIKNQIDDSKGLLEFQDGNYRFDKALSTDKYFVFTR